MGYLTGKITATTKFDPKTDLRSGFDRFSPGNIAANMPIVDLLTRCAATENATPAQLALAWLLAKKPFIVSIPGTRNIDHLRENLGALDVQWTAADLSALDADFSKLTVHGGRMNEMQCAPWSGQVRGREHAYRNSRFGFDGRKARHDLRESGARCRL